MLASSQASEAGIQASETGKFPSSVTPSAAWASVWILLIFSVLSVLDRQIIALLVDDIKADLGLSDTQLGLLQGLAFSLFYCIAAVPLGWAVDRYPRKIIIYLGISFWSLSAAACGLATNFWQLFLARLGVGVGEASLTPAAVSLISDIFPREKIGRAMGLYTCGILLGGGVSLIISGFIVSMFSGQPFVDFPLIGRIAPWQAVFLITGLPGVIIGLLAFLLSDPRSSAQRAQMQSDPARMNSYLARHWKLLLLIFGGFACNSLTFYSVGAWTPAFLSRMFGMSPAEIGSFWGLTLAGGGAAGALLGGQIIDRVYRAGVEDSYIFVPAIAALIAWPLMAIGYHLPTPTLVLASLGLGTVMTGIASAGSFVALQRIGPAKFRGRLTAYFGLINVGFGASLGPVATGLVTDYVFGDESKVGWSLSIVVSFALLLLATALLTARPSLRRLMHEQDAVA